MHKNNLLSFDVFMIFLYLSFLYISFQFFLETKYKLDYIWCLKSTKKISNLFF